MQKAAQVTQQFYKPNYIRQLTPRNMFITCWSVGFPYAIYYFYSTRNQSSRRYLDEIKFGNKIDQTDEWTRFKGRIGLPTRYPRTPEEWDAWDEYDENLGRFSVNYAVTEGEKQRLKDKWSRGTAWASTNNQLGRDYTGLEVE